MPQYSDQDKTCEMVGKTGNSTSKLFSFKLLIHTWQKTKMIEPYLYFYVVITRYVVIKVGLKTVTVPKHQNYVYSFLFSV